MPIYREHVKGSGKNKKGKYIIIEAETKSKAKARFRKITLQSDKGSIFRTKTKDATKHGSDKYKVYYDSVYVGKKFKGR